MATQPNPPSVTDKSQSKRLEKACGLNKMPLLPAGRHYVSRNCILAELLALPFGPILIQVASTANQFAWDLDLIKRISKDKLNIRENPELASPSESTQKVFLVRTSSSRVREYFSDKEMKSEHKSEYIHKTTYEYLYRCSRYKRLEAVNPLTRTFAQKIGLPVDDIVGCEEIFFFESSPLTFNRFTERNADAIKNMFVGDNIRYFEQLATTTLSVLDVGVVLDKIAVLNFVRETASRIANLSREYPSGFRLSFSGSETNILGLLFLETFGMLRIDNITGGIGKNDDNKSVSYQISIFHAPAHISDYRNVFKFIKQSMEQPRTVAEAQLPETMSCGVEGVEILPARKIVQLTVGNKIQQFQISNKSWEIIYEICINSRRGAKTTLGKIIRLSGKSISAKSDMETVEKQMRRLINKLTFEGFRFLRSSEVNRRDREYWFEKY